MKRFHITTVVLTSVLVFNAVQAISQGVSKTSEQRHFSAEDEGVRHPVKIPEGVFRILRQDKLVNDIAKSQNVIPEEVPSGWFSGSRIELGGAGPQDLIVVAEGPLAGGNVDTFWVFVHESRGFRLALMVSAHDLLVKSTRSHGYRDLEALAATAVTLSTVRFKFNRGTYEEYASKSEDIK